MSDEGGFGSDMRSIMLSFLCNYLQDHIQKFPNFISLCFMKNVACDNSSSRNYLQELSNGGPLTSAEQSLTSVYPSTQNKPH